MPIQTDDIPNKFVVGLMFNQDLTTVGLIEKLEPEWQRGKFNGPGGKIKYGETCEATIAREYMEETGVLTSPLDWKIFAQMEGKNDDGFPFQVAFLCIRDNRVFTVEKQEGCDEEPFYASISTLDQERLIDNLTWLIPLAIDVLKDGRPHMAHITYL